MKKAQWKPQAGWRGKELIPFKTLSEEFLANRDRLYNLMKEKLKPGETGEIENYGSSSEKDKGVWAYRSEDFDLN